MSNRGKIWKIGSYYTLERENKVGNPEGMVVALNTGNSGNNNSTCTINFTSGGGSTLFGDLSLTRQQGGALGSGTRAFAYGGVGGGDPALNTIDYVERSSKGNFSDFGDRALGRRGPTKDSIGNNTRGLMAGGKSPSVNNIDFLKKL